MWPSPSWQRSTPKLRVHYLNQELMLPTCRQSLLLTPTTKSIYSLVLQWPLTRRNCMLLEKLQQWNFSKSLSRNSLKDLEPLFLQRVRSHQDHLKWITRLHHQTRINSQTSRKPCWTLSTREMMINQNLFTSPWFGKCRVSSPRPNPRSSQESTKQCKTKARMIDWTSVDKMILIFRSTLYIFS